MSKDKDNREDKGTPDEDTTVHLVPVSMTHHDWEYLSETSMAWDYFNSSDHLGRFESHSASAKPLEAKFLVANWYGDNYANLLLAKSYLDALGFGWVALWDMAEANDAGDLMGYVLLTDYNAEKYRRLGEHKESGGGF